MSKWRTFEEYKRRVKPQIIRRNTDWRELRDKSLFVRIGEVMSHMEEIERHLEKLQDRLEQWEKNQKEYLPSRLAENLWMDIHDITCFVESLLLLDPALCNNRWSDQFVKAKILRQDWKCQRRRGGAGNRRLYYETRAFAAITQKLWERLRDEFMEAHNFLIDFTRALPEYLQSDFQTARDLFSVGMDEAGAFFAGRGLEAVLRELARTLKIRVEHKSKQMPLHEMDFADVAEVFRRARWKSNRHAVIDRQEKALLDMLRTARNATAHRSKKAADQHEDPDWREIAKLSTKTANAIWLTSGKGRKKLTTTIIVRDW